MAKRRLYKALTLEQRIEQLEGMTHRHFCPVCHRYVDSVLFGGSLCPYCEEGTYLEEQSCAD